MRFINSGQTPAYKVFITGILFKEIPENALNWEWPNPKVFCRKSSEKHEYKLGVLAHETQKYIRIKPENGIIDIDDMKKEKLYARGIVCYEDIFGEGHYTEFCVIWPNEMASEASGVGICNELNRIGDY